MSEKKMDSPGTDPFLLADSEAYYINSSFLISLIPSSTLVTDFYPNSTDLVSGVSVSGNMSDDMEKVTCEAPTIPPPHYERAFFIFVYGLVSVTSIMGNGIVCYIVARFERMRKTENFFIFNLALTDMIMACLCVPFTFVPNLIIGYYPFGWLMCKVMNYSQIVTVLVSSYTLVAIAVERYLGVVFPFRPKMRRRKAVLVMLITWVLALAVSLPTVLYQGLHDSMISDGSYRTHCMEIWPAAWTDDVVAGPKASYLSYVYGMILMTLQYFFPVGILVFTYTTIAIHVWRTKTPGEALKDRDKKIKDEKYRMTKMMVVVVGLYIVSWLPLNAFNVIADQYSREMFCFKYIHYFWFACHWIAMSHATVNPIIYFWMNSKFRAGFIYALKLMFCCRRQPDEWLMERKLVGGYNQSTKKFSQVFNRYDSVANGGPRNGTVRRVDYNGQSVRRVTSGSGSIQSGPKTKAITTTKGDCFLEKSRSQPEAVPLMTDHAPQIILTSESDSSPSSSS